MLPSKLEAGEFWRAVTIYSSDETIMGLCLARCRYVNGINTPCDPVGVPIVRKGTAVAYRVDGEDKYLLEREFCLEPLDVLTLKPLHVAAA